MPSYHLNSSDDAEEIYTGKHVGTNCSTVGIHRNSTHHYKTGKLSCFTLTFTVDLTAHCATRQTRDTTRQTSSKAWPTHTQTITASRLPHRMTILYM